MGLEVPEFWDGKSFFTNIENNENFGRESVIISQNAWSCQRTVRFNNWTIIKTYHTGLKNFPEIMLYDYEKDFHMIKNIAEEKPEVVAQGLNFLNKWYEDNQEKFPNIEDPMKIVLREGGPFHTREQLPHYLRRLKRSEREYLVERILDRKESYSL